MKTASILQERRVIRQLPMELTRLGAFDVAHVHVGGAPMVEAKIDAATYLHEAKLCACESFDVDVGIPCKTRIAGTILVRANPQYGYSRVKYTPGSNAEAAVDESRYDPTYRLGAVLQDIKAHVTPLLNSLPPP